MYLVKVNTPIGPRFNIVRGCGAMSITINPEPFRKEEVAYRWMHQHATRLIKEDSNLGEKNEVYNNR